MSKVVSKDGTEISYSKCGSGKPLILVDGAMCYRELGPAKSMAKALEDRFTVITFDRRGRGESGNTLPYSVDREIEDIEALINEAGGSAYLCGFSSGAVLSLEAVRAGVSAERLALFEPPFIVDSSRTPVPDDFIENLDNALDKGDRGRAVKSFLKLVGMPAIMTYIMPLMPGWKKLKGTAHTLPYDLGFVSGFQKGKPLPRDRWNAVAIPTTVLVGGKSPEWMKNAMNELADILPNASLRSLVGQTHMVKANALAPVLKEDFLSTVAERTNVYQSAST
jgi:pimeloyl-ACP methyl ester carboxylesterase